MTGLRLELANPDSFESPKDYVERHLAPVAAELHRLTNELLAPGATSPEEWSVDMVPGKVSGVRFARFTKPLKETSKHVTFDGTEYFTIPKEMLRAKQVKVKLTATVYVIGDGSADFRLSRDDNMVVAFSHFSTSSRSPETLTATLPFGEVYGCVSPDKRTYYIEGMSAKGGVTPVCRRLSMSFVYI